MSYDMQCLCGSAKADSSFAAEYSKATCRLCCGELSKNYKNRAELDAAVEELCSFAERAAQLLDSHAKQCLPMVVENGDHIFDAAQRVRELMKTGK